MIKEYEFWYDPGHAWLLVPVSDIIKAGIGTKISRYSYLYKGSVLLEEDCDAPLFIEAMKEKGIEVKFKTVAAKIQVRELPCY